MLSARRISGQLQEQDLHRELPSILTRGFCRAVFESDSSPSSLSPFARFPFPFPLSAVTLPFLIPWASNSFDMVNQSMFFFKACSRTLITTACTKSGLH